MLKLQIQLVAASAFKRRRSSSQESSIVKYSNHHTESAKEGFSDAAAGETSPSITAEHHK